MSKEKKAFNTFSVRVDDFTLDKIEEVQLQLNVNSRNVAIQFILNQGLLSLADKGLISSFVDKENL